MKTARKALNSRTWTSGTKIRSEHQPLRINQVYAWLFSCDGKIAIVSKDGRKWQLPGGKPNKHETCLQTVVREVAEETGIDTRSLISCYQFFGYYTIVESDGHYYDDKYLQLRLSLKLNKDASEYILHQQNEDKQQNQKEQIRYAKFVTINEFVQYIPWASKSAELQAATQSWVNNPANYTSSRLR